MTDSQTGRGDLRRIDDQAAAWAARRLSGAFDQDDEARFRAWLAEDARHAVALNEYMAIADASALAGAVGGLKEAANDEAAQATPSRRRWLQWGAPAIAASLFAAFFFFTAVRETPANVEQYATARGETRDISLPDGTTVSLNTDTVLTFSSEKDGRYAGLERGEAYFDVVHDQARPFIVDAGEARATVLGTTFTVRIKDDASVVGVLRGRVAVHSITNDSATDGVHLEPGERVAVTSTGDVGGIDAFDAAAAATWRYGYLYFDETPLNIVVKDLNRYFDRQVELADAALGAAPVSGRVELGNQDVAIRAISVALSLKAEQRNPDKIVLKADD